MKIFTKRLSKILAKLQESFLDENRENKKMLDIYIKYSEGSATENELEQANSQLSQVLKNLGLDAKTAEADAEGIEHHVSDKTLKKMEQFNKKN